jgi:hypothetical protein
VFAGPRVPSEAVAQVPVGGVEQAHGPLTGRRRRRGSPTICFDELATS